MVMVDRQMPALLSYTLLLRSLADRAHSTLPLEESIVFLLGQPKLCAKQSNAIRPELPIGVLLVPNNMAAGATPAPQPPLSTYTLARRHGQSVLALRLFFFFGLVSSVSSTESDLTGAFTSSALRILGLRM